MERRLKTMDDMHLDGQTVLVRVDFNVSVGDDGVVSESEDYRIEAALPTIQDLRRRRCRIILLTHLGRPGEEDGAFDVQPVVRRLQQLIGEDIKMVDALWGSKVETAVAAAEHGAVIMLPNVRLDDREMMPSEKFGAELAASADVYINEAFSNSHRAHTSMVVLPQLLPSCAGKRVVMEVEALKRLTHDPQHPYVAIISGAKITTKVGMLREILSKVDKLCLAGQIANVFLAAQGLWQTDRFHPDEVEAARSLLASDRDKLILPVDVVIGDDKATPESVRTVPVSDVPADIDGVWDIGPQSVAAIIEACKGAKTVMWNGPVGKFEIPAYAHSTQVLAEALAAQSSYRVVGGGDTVNALERYRLIQKFNHVSVGGGAMIAFLEGKRMPGLEPLYQQ